MIKIGIDEQKNAFFEAVETNWKKLQRQQRKQVFEIDT
jgi:hypothetical protein